jgi:hypothetical protein
MKAMNWMGWLALACACGGCASSSPNPGNSASAQESAFEGLSFRPPMDRAAEADLTRDPLDARHGQAAVFVEP